MSIHQTKTGQWFVAYREKGDRRVKRKYFSFGADGKLEAKQWDADYQSQARIASRRPKLGVPSMTFSDLAEKYLNSRPLTPASKQAIIYALNGHVVPLFGHLDVKHLSMTHLIDLDQKLQAKNLSLATRNRYCAYCRAICQWAYNNDFAPTNPFEKFRADIKREGKAPELIKEFELRAIMNAAAPHLQWAIEVMLNTGVRPGPTELFTIKISDIDFAREGLWITRKKTHDKSTLLPLLPEFLKKVQSLLEEDPGRQYLIEYHGNPVSSLKKSWSTALKKAGITRRLRLYDLRHWYATALLSGGADVKASSELLGHTNPSTTLKTYYHVFEHQKREALGKLLIPNLNLPTDKTE